MSTLGTCYFNVWPKIEISPYLRFLNMKWLVSELLDTSLGMSEHEFILETLRVFDNLKESMCKWSVGKSQKLLPFLISSKFYLMGMLIGQGCGILKFSVLLTFQSLKRKCAISISISIPEEKICEINFNINIWKIF